MACLEKDKKEMLAFYDFPAIHWQHIRTSNSIESTFATVRLRTAKTRGCFARHTILSMVYKLGQSSQKKWRRLRGFRLLAEIIPGVEFRNGEPVEAIVEDEAVGWFFIKCTFSNTRIDYNSSAAFYSLIETAKANGIEPNSYLKSVMSG